MCIVEDSFGSSNGNRLLLLRWSCCTLRWGLASCLISRCSPRCPCLLLSLCLPPLLRTRGLSLGLVCSCPLFCIARCSSFRWCSSFAGTIAVHRQCTCLDSSIVGWSLPLLLLWLILGCDRLAGRAYTLLALGVDCLCSFPCPCSQRSFWNCTRRHSTASEAYKQVDCHGLA